MSYSIKALTADEWMEWSEAAHENVFSEARENSHNRADFALISLKIGEPTGFIQCKEIDSKTLYLQTGGAFKNFQGTSAVFGSYSALIDWCAENYERVITKVNNENVRMIRLAMSVGFRIIGSSAFKGKVTLEMEHFGG